MQALFLMYCVNNMYFLDNISYVKKADWTDHRQRLLNSSLGEICSLGIKVGGKQAVDASSALPSRREAELCSRLLEARSPGELMH